AYLAARGVDVTGVDLAPEMVQVARECFPTMSFVEGDMMALPVADGALAGIVAFYAIVNVPPDAVGRAFTDMARARAPGGLLLLSFHVGDEKIHRDDLWGVAIDLDFWLFPLERIERDLAAAGLRVEAKLERDAHPGAEVQTHRAYLLARKG